jgi:hypothetical protein
MATWFLRIFSFRDNICPEEYFWAHLGSFCSLNGTDCVSGYENYQLSRILERFICECWFAAYLHWDSIFHTPNNVKFPLNSHEGVCWNSSIISEQKTRKTMWTKIRIKTCSQKNDGNRYLIHLWNMYISGPIFQKGMTDKTNTRSLGKRDRIERCCHCKMSAICNSSSCLIAGKQLIFVDKILF